MLSLKKRWFVYLIFTLLIVTAILAWAIWQKTSLDRSSRAAVAQTIAVVLDAEQYSTLVTSAFEDRINQRPAAEFTNYLAAMKQTLGPFTEVAGVYGEAQVPLLNLTSEPIAANYEADLNFARGPATLRVTLYYTGGQWQISLFMVDSQLLLN
ncbi:MAG: hypothetical protein ACI95C_000942 [Pseudohongiellaceae bacterium]|jgi:hypothetical protein